MIQVTGEFILDSFFSRAACANMFKIFLALISIAFISSSGELLGVIQLEDKANEGKFQLEEKYEKSLNDINCNSLKTGKAKCKLVKYRVRTVETMSQFGVSIITRSSNAAIFFMLLCSVSFVGIPHREKYNKCLGGSDKKDSH